MSLDNDCHGGIRSDRSARDRDVERSRGKVLDLRPLRLHLSTGQRNN
jgi:hypothetical protein